MNEQIYMELFVECRKFWSECVINGHAATSADYRAREWWDRFGGGLPYPTFISEL